MASLNFNSGNNYIIPTENDMTYRGLGGDDVYIISKAIPGNTKIQIIDTEGSNIIELVDGITITTSLFTKNATRLTLSNGSEVTINGADKFTYETSGNSTTGDVGSQWSYSDFVKGMGVTDGPPSSGSKNGTSSFIITDTFEVPETEDTDNSLTEYTIVNINVSSDSTINATSSAEDFRYEVGVDGISKEGAYDVTIAGFDKANDKLTLIIIGGSSNLTTQEFDSIENVDVISNGISGTEIYFAPDPSKDSGTLKIPNVEEFIEDLWVATSYTVEIIADVNLV
ncbi:hypothetical protein N9S49_00765 [Rhodobiaceae bacterium]|jgi:hypothetical protein|nr:hypothetical protein [Rhodobiaceae bacterium]